MGNSLLDYMDKMAPFIYAALDSDPNDDYDVLYYNINMLFKFQSWHVLILRFMV